jgi:MFS superfamily sulfate permease-like transporter
MIPGELVAVVISVLLNYFFSISENIFKIESRQLVQLPVIKTPTAFLSQLSFPDISGFSNYRVWLTGLTIAVVAGIESLLCLEAAEKLDPLKRHANSNRELLAQGFGNMLSGFMGGLPMASVIVRTSANVSSGAKTKLATILHGIFLFLAAALVPAFINQIPLASLAAILIMIGFKLANPLLFIQRWKSGMNEFIPFMVTVVGVIFTDLLIGVTLGMLVSAIQHIVKSRKM